LLFIIVIGAYSKLQGRGRATSLQCVGGMEYADVWSEIVLQSCVLRATGTSFPITCPKTASIKIYLNYLECLMCVCALLSSDNWAHAMYDDVQ